MTKLKVPLPHPNEAAMRGLHRINGYLADFKPEKRRTLRHNAKSDEDAAIDFLNELIAFWNLPYEEWRVNEKTYRGR